MQVKQHSLTGVFEIDSCFCEDLKFRMPDGSSVKLISTRSSNKSSTTEKLLVVSYRRLSPSSPEWAGVQQSVEAVLSSLHFCIHQDAILDLARETATWIANVQSRAAKLMVAAPASSEPAAETHSSGARAGTPKRETESPINNLRRQGASRRLSKQNSVVLESGGVGLMRAKAKGLQRNR